MEETLTVEKALVQAVFALQQVERLAEGAPLQGLSYAAAALVSDVLAVIMEDNDDSEEEN